MNKFKFYTDGIKTIKVFENDTPPSGFYPGRTFKVNPWNKGHTAETDPRVKNGALKSGNTRKERKVQPWNKGLTKEINSSLQVVSDKVSKARTGKPSWNKGIPMREETKLKLSESHKGKPCWCKGFTKDTHPSLKSSSEKQKGKPKPPIDWNVAKKKEYETKKKNHSFNISKSEEAFYEYLKTQYQKDDIYRQYFDPDRYPFKCDFYIKSQDLFIEYNGSWAHNNHPFDNNNQLDLDILQKWIEKAETSIYYKSAIYTWTDLDVRKLNAFRQNNLNFEIIYPNNITITS